MLTPDILFDSYRDITPAFLQGQGVTLLLTDLDYTLAPKAVRRPDDALRQWIDGLKDAGITVMIVSNNRSGVRVTEFCGDLASAIRAMPESPVQRACGPLWSEQEQIRPTPPCWEISC